MVGVVSGSLYRSIHSLSRHGLVLGRRPLGAILHSSNEPGELLQWLCHDDSTINIVLVIIMPPPRRGGGGIKRSSASVVRLMSRTSALTRKPKGLGRRNFAQGYPRSHATTTPTSRSRSRGQLVHRSEMCQYFANG